MKRRESPMENVSVWTDLVGFATSDTISTHKKKTSWKPQSKRKEIARTTDTIFIESCINPQKYMDLLQNEKERFSDLHSIKRCTNFHRKYYILC